MMRLALCVLLAVFSSPAQAQPLDCSANEHCPNGFYCGSDLHFCRECLNCKDLNREPPKVATSCITSVAECGRCFKGMVDDRWGDSNASCVLPDGREEAVLPIYVWVVIVLGVILAAVIAVVLLLRNTDTFNIKACTRTSVESPCPVPPASAPPPPYTDYPFVPVNPASPAPQYSTGDHDETSWPLVKREPAPAHVPAGARERDGSQEARVFSNPAYVRGPHLPPSYEAPSVESDHEAPFVPVDEETMESPWTPNVPTTNDTSASVPAGALASSSEAEATSNSMAVALRRQTHPDGPPAKMLRQDTNNNRNREDNGSGNGNNFPSSAPASGAPSVIINVLSVNTVQQRSDIRL